MNRIQQIMVNSFAAMLVFIINTGCRKTEPTSESEGQQAKQTEIVEAVAGNEFQQGMKIMAADKPIDIEVGHLVPCVTDWNSDGKKDLIVGQFADGAIRLYLNEGTDAEPVFNDFSFLQADGKQIKMDSG